MHVDYALPIAYIDDTVKDTVAIISRKKLGCAAILDEKQKLVGIFTDGELRRNIDLTNLLERKISEVMTKNPITINSNSLVLEALDLMNKKLITTLFVVDHEQHLEGVIHMHDCLKAGATPEFK